MIISDLQYIESVDNSEVEGAGYYYRSAYADAKGKAESYGDYTSSKVYTSALADADYGYSYASSHSTASAKSKYYYYY